jgi:hypothetical protein
MLKRNSMTLRGEVNAELLQSDFGILWTSVFSIAIRPAPFSRKKILRCPGRKMIEVYEFIRM